MTLRKEMDGLEAPDRLEAAASRTYCAAAPQMCATQGDPTSDSKVLRTAVRGL